MKISKLNEVYLTLEVDDSLEKELSDYYKNLIGVK